ncbi:MAG: LarC family nickel insertion protein [Lachnospiraceae bacterium]
MNQLYLECYSGISGDMTVAALLDLGVDQEKLKEILYTLPLSGFSIEISRVKKSGIDAADFLVKLEEEYENHDHDMEYLHGHEHGHEHGHKHEHKHGHEHEHKHDHEAKCLHAHTHNTTHVHRGMKEVLEIINASGMSERAKKTAEEIFTVLGKAEAKAHATTLEQVHFHEVGAVDSIVDIAAVAVCLDLLNIEQVIVPFVCEGSGTVRCQHGILPIPVPAVANIAAANKIKIKMLPVKGELITPTGAAIVAATSTSDQLPETFRIKKIGIGAGKRDYACTGILRAMIID